MSYRRAAHGLWQCPHCKFWYDDDDGHDVELCESAKEEAADHKRRERRDEPRTDRDCEPC